MQRLRTPRAIVLLSRAMLAALALGAATPAHAQNSAVQLSGGLEQTAADYGDTSYSLGYLFTANSAVTVTALGFYDDGTGVNATGMKASHQVGLFDAATQQLLVQGTVDPTGTYDNLFRYTSVLTDATGGVPVTTFTLEAGHQYVAVAVTGGDEFVNVGPSFDLPGNPASFSTDAAITYDEDRTFAPNADGSGSHDQSALTFANFSSHNDFFGDGSTNFGYFGPNFQFTATTSVPEPSSVAAFAFTGLLSAGLILWARRRAAR